MSSLRIRTKNKLLTALGAAKPSTNVAFDLAYSDFENMLARLSTLDSSLRSYAGSLKAFHNSASAMVGAIDGLAFGGGGAASLQNTTNGSTEMQQFSGEARVACADVDMMVLQEITDRLETEVLLPVRGWIKHAKGLQQQAAAFQEQKALYDHYTRKVSALRETHEKRSSPGRHEKSKDTERMFRNEQKLAATTQEYTRLSESIVRDLRAFVISRDAALAPLLRRVLRSRVVYATRMHEASSRIRALVDDGAEESADGGVLGQFASLAQGGPAVGASTIMAAATSPLPTPCSVRKASFDDFVGGEATSPVPNRTDSRKTVADDGWASFASPVPPPAHETQMASPTNHENFSCPDPRYTPPLSVPQFMTINTPTSAPTQQWGGEFPAPAPAFSTMPANVAATAGMAMTAPPSAQVSSWDAFPPASAPPDPFASAEWGTPVTSPAPWQQSQQQIPVNDFRDMHLNAFGGGMDPFARTE
ncbi:hypothetical protein PHYBOEH_001406 [Phytophthora boehmeriae]|uniref:BAR domain-containing protein n=1 Tax=Phytophthora boehmeriae TaxID=109152 RepID=A0A8T1X7T3_9STRA|nr:hypothetical protein PHYBOEH_001406 [Phytophthora boehmeriae]